MSSAQLLSSKTVIQEEPPALRAIQGVATAVGMCVGVTRKGPIGVATLVTSYAQWRRIFGGEIGAGVAALAVQGFFTNAGGSGQLYFTRTVHYTAIDNANSKTSAAGTLNLKTSADAPSAGSVLGSNVGPFDLAVDDTLAVTIDGAGSPSVASISATAASQLAGNSGPYALADGDVLNVKIDGGSPQSIAFLAGEFAAIGAATANEVAAVLNSKLSGGSADAPGSPQISSATLGTGSRVQVTGGSANSALGFPTGAANGTGNVADTNAVTAAELTTIIESAISGCVVSSVGGRLRISSSSTGPSSSVRVMASSSADDELGLDNATHSGSDGGAVDTLTIDAKYDGTYADDVTVLITAASSHVASEFNLQILDDGVLVNGESFPNLSMDPSSERYVETVVNSETTGSQYISVTDLAISTSADTAAARPASSPGSTPVAFGPLAGGDDGLALLGDVDFIGDDSAKNGIRSFDLKNDGTLLFVPDRPTPAVHQAMLVYCEVTRSMSMFAILDSPPAMTAQGIVDYVETTAAILNLSEFGAIYWPQIKVLNPSRETFGSADSIVVPPSGHIAGLYVRKDGARVGGVYDPPGGAVNGRLLGITGLETEEVLEETRRDLVYPKRINPISRERGQPFALDGVRTLRSNAGFPTIGERRGMIFIEQSIKDGIAFARLRNNDETLRDEVDRTIESFMNSQMRIGAFRSKDPATAYFVDVSEQLNPPSEVFAGRLNVRVGAATQKPAEFVIISFSQDTRAIEEELAAAG